MLHNLKGASEGGYQCCLLRKKQHTDGACCHARIRYRIFELHEKTLLAYGILQEMKAIWKGHSSEIIQCYRDVEALEREIEVCRHFVVLQHSFTRNTAPQIKRAMVLKNRYYLWKWPNISSPINPIHRPGQSIILIRIFHTSFSLQYSKRTSSLVLLHFNIHISVVISYFHMGLIFLHGRDLVQTEINKALTCLPHFTT